MSIGDTLNRGRKPSQNTIRQFQKYDSEPPGRLFQPSMARGVGFDTPARTSRCAFALRFPRFAQSPARPSLVGRSRHTPLTLASLEVRPGHPGVASQIEFPQPKAAGRIVPKTDAQRSVEPRGARQQQETVRRFTASASNTLLEIA